MSIDEFVFNEVQDVALASGVVAVVSIIITLIVTVVVLVTMWAIYFFVLINKSFLIIIRFIWFEVWIPSSTEFLIIEMKYFYIFYYQLNNNILISTSKHVFHFYQQLEIILNWIKENPLTLFFDFKVLNDCFKSIYLF